MGRVIISGGARVTAPISGILLSSFSEGSLVKVLENGSPVEFYVAKHDYESELNGAGRTLLVRKDCYDRQVFDSARKSAYSTSEIVTWLTNEYIDYFDTKTKTIIGTTKFSSLNSSNNSWENPEHPAFLLSMTEVGLSADYSNTEGTMLPTAALLRVAKKDGVAVDWWTRTANVQNSVSVYYIRGDQSSAVYGSESSGTAKQYAPYVRPCFTLPSNSLFDKNTLILKGVV